MGNYKSRLNCIHLAQKMAVRAITFSLLRTSSGPLFKQFGILDDLGLHELAVLTFGYDLYNRKLPHTFLDYCKIVHHTNMKQQEKKMLCYPCQFVGRHKVHSPFLFLDRSFGTFYLRRLENKKQDIHFVIPSQFI